MMNPIRGNRRLAAGGSFVWFGLDSPPALKPAHGLLCGVLLYLMVAARPLDLAPPITLLAAGLLIWEITSRAWRPARAVLALLVCAVLLPGRPVVLRGVAAWQQQVCRSRAQDCANALWRYARDHGDRLPPGGLATSVALAPYLRDEGSLRCPLAADGDIRFRLNPLVRGQRRQDIPYPHRTVVLFESWYGAPTGNRHGGLCTLVLADGTVRQSLVSDQSLLWDPQRPGAPPRPFWDGAP